MTPASQRLAVAWAHLIRPSVSALATYPVAETPEHGVVRAALDREGRRHLLVSVEDGFREPLDRLPLLGLSSGPYSFDGSATPYLDIECRDPLYEGQFGRLCVDVLTTVETSRLPGTAALLVVEKWRRLFSSTRTGILTEQRRLALFAELTMLKELLVADGSITADVWRGPKRETHDFVLPLHAVEVKAAGMDSTHITVHGLEQLAPPPGKQLSLCVGYVLEDPEGQSIGALVDDVRDRLDDAGTLDDLLADAGCCPVEPPTPYTVADWWVVPATAGLPRLVPESLVAGQAPQGIASIRYDIDIQAVRRSADGRTVGLLAQEVTR